MSFLKKLFAAKENSPEETSNFEYLIIANVVMSHGWNDPSEILESNKSLILDSVSKNDLNERLNFWNKKYYDDITQHYSITEEQLESISEIINVDSSKARELYAHWPKNIDNELYSALNEKLSLSFVQVYSITEEMKGKYGIVLNEDFWNIPTHNSNVLTNIINTYERSFSEFELIHGTQKDAINYALIIIDRLCYERPPDTGYYYHDKLKKLSGHSGTIPSFGYNSMLHKNEDKLNEYNRIISEKATELDLMTGLIEQLESKPFKIVKL